MYKVIGPGEQVLHEWIGKGTVHIVGDQGPVYLYGVGTAIRNQGWSGLAVFSQSLPAGPTDYQTHRKELRMILKSRAMLRRLDFNLSAS